MTRHRWLMCVFFIVGAASLPAQVNRQPRRPVFRQIAVDQFAHFVVASAQSMRNRTAVLAFARSVCGNQRICFVHFWTSEAKAGRRTPMTDRQANAIVASYNRNLNTGNDAFQCYNFGAKGEHC